LIADQVRQRHWLAELLAAARQRHRHVDRLPAADAAHRGALRPLRRTSWAPIRGRAAAERAALLHQRHRARVPARAAEIDLTAARTVDPAGIAVASSLQQQVSFELTRTDNLLRDCAAGLRGALHG